jgi:endonuclease YncB( thermonuclease family)
MVALAFAIVIVVFATARLDNRAEAPEAVASPTTTTSTSGERVTALDQRSDGWYLSAHERYPLVMVERVIDGDTLDVSVGGTTLRVRLFGADAPEEGERCYTEAGTRLTTLAADQVRLAPDVRQQDGFGRELRYVFTPSGRSLDAALIHEGLAKAWREDGGLRDLLGAVEDGAHAARRGCVWTG